jgi:phosphoribosylamine--glycine ligase
MPNTSKRLRTLIIGNGGREHALYWKLSQSPLAEVTQIMPGNAGIPSVYRLQGIDTNSFSAVLEAITMFEIDLVIVGPEKLLVEGLGDYLAEMAPQVLFFGPSKKAARIEGSKLYCKQICTKYGIPTAEYEYASDIHSAHLLLEKSSTPIVIKADGLCAGKGVVIADTFKEAIVTLEKFLVEGIHGDEGKTVVLERKLEGDECSIMALCDGENIVVMQPARDHKRLRAGSDGPDNPNTGGMGAYSPVPDVDIAMQLRIRQEILEPLVKAMQAEGVPYKGVIFAGIMVTKEGPMLLEVNCRFGDPETQTLVPRIESDLLPYLVAVCNGTLGEMEPLEWSKDYSVCVNKVSRGYPAKPETGFVIEGLFEASSCFHAHVFHAGTELKGDKFVTADGRVLGVVGKGKNLREACVHAYEAADLIDWDGAYQRDDIGK